MQFDVECSFYECMTMKLTVDAADIGDACQKGIEEANDRSDWNRCDWSGDTFVSNVSGEGYGESLPLPAEFADPMSPRVPLRTGPAWSDADLAAMTAPAREDGPRVEKVCERCLSRDVVVDAWCSWNPHALAWEVESTFAFTYCKTCEGETRVQTRHIVAAA